MVSQNFELPISAFKPSRNVLYVVFNYNEISFHFILFVKLTWSKWTHWPFGSLCVWKCMWFWVTICHLCEFLPLFHGLSHLTIHIQRQRRNASGRDQFKAFLWSGLFSLLWGKNRRQKCERHRTSELRDSNPQVFHSTIEQLVGSLPNTHKRILLAFQTSVFVCSFTSLEVFSNENKRELH